MEYVGTQNIKKICNFYVSDLHLSVMMLPYISKQINEDVEITTIFDKIDKKNIEVVLDKLNLKNKDKILGINWFNNNNTKKEISDSVKASIRKNKKNIIMIGGEESFVLKNNELILDCINENQVDFESLKLINCYNVDEMGTRIKGLVKEYDYLLNTSGEVKID